MTEEEARETWCGGPPQVAYAISNRGTSREGERYCCIASDCMMWRWNRKLTDIDSKERFTEGYCGIGGKP